MENDEQVQPVDRDDARSQLESLAADRATTSASAAAPWWFIVLHGACIAGFALSFGLGDRQPIGFVVSALALIGLGIVRPWVTRTHAEPWARSRRAVGPGVTQILVGIIIIAGGVIAYAGFNLEWALWPTALLAGGTTVLFGMQMERALTRDVAEGA